MDKEQLKNHFVSKKSGKLSAIALRWHNIKTHPEVYSYMVNYFPDMDEQFIIANDIKACEIYYRIINDIYEIPKCPVCGTPLKFLRYDRGYGLFCGNKCRYSEEGLKIINELIFNSFNEKYGCWCFQSDIVRDKITETFQEKYGGNSPSCDKNIAQKQYETKKQLYGEHYEKIVEKTKQTCQERYGKDFVMQVDEFKDKMKQTQQEIYGGCFNPNKTKETNLERYGLETYTGSDDWKKKYSESIQNKYGESHPMKVEDIREKQKHTMLDKYGYDHNFKDPNLIAYLKSDNVREKQWETKKKRGNTNTSSLEIKFKQYLEEHHYKFLQNHKDNRYPYHVDFYLNDFDLFIELQGTWIHGGHPFDEHNQKDIEQIKKWESKSNEYNFKGQLKKQYLSALQVWVNKDVEKRNIAKQNNLNYLEIFSCNINECIAQLKQKITQINK